MHQCSWAEPARLPIVTLTSLILVALAGSASAQSTTTTTTTTTTIVSPTTTLPMGDALRGGQLWDKWWLVNGSPAPAGEHPLYPPAGLTTGSSTYRCKECHGWDYKGAGGAYGSGPHFTGISGVLGSLMSPVQMAEIVKSDVVVNGHGFAALGLTDQDVADLVAFLQTLLIDTDVYIDPVGVFVGDPVAGGTNFASGGTLPCTTCHGANGAAINFATPEAPEWIGTIAAHNPWELMHKIRFGQPGTPMPSWLAGGGTNQGVADIGRYAQLNLPVDCVNDGHCDDGNVCTDDVCLSGICDNSVVAAGTACDDGQACTATDVCDAAGICSGTVSCAAGESCNPLTGMCDVPSGCTLDAECDDGLFCTGVEVCFAGFCGPGVDPCVGGVCDEVGDSCLPVGDPLRGGQLWDEWWLVNGSAAPVGEHPLYPPVGLTTGSSTYRCKECHGWDYKGAGGAYAAGPHFTGIPGVLGSLMTASQMTEIIKSDVVVNGHGFAVLGLSDQDVADLVEFLQTLLIDTDAYIDTLGEFLGDPIAGQTNFTSGGTLPCTTCHGVDGTAINFGTPSAPEYLGAHAEHNPWEFMHKVRFGQPGTPMPTWLGSGGTNQGVADIGRYVQLSLPADCLNDGHCDDGNVCTDDTCNTGHCGNAANLAACDDGNLCTTLDSCDGAGLCAGTPLDCSALSDGCNDGTCEGSTGACIAVAHPDASACDDGLFCNGTDSCLAGACAAHTGDPCVTPLECRASCDEVADACVDAIGTPCSDDGNVCSEDICDGLGNCIHPNNGAACDDGVFCNGADICKGGLCGLHLGDPCSVGEVCNETTALCEPEPCVDVTVGDGVSPVQCSVGSECTVGVGLVSGSFSVASVVATVAATTPTSCGADCVAGTAATNGSCTLNDTTCRFAVADLVAPITAFADGDVAALTLQCTAEASGQLCVTEAQAGGTGGGLIPTCGQNCVAFECTTCLPGDCNATGTIDAADPICAVLCLIGSAPAGADCSCGADCNCLGGTDAADPICTVLRLIDTFSPDTCTVAPPSASVLYRPGSGASAVALEVGEPQPLRKGRRLRATVRLSGDGADMAAGMRAALWGDARIRGIRLSRRLKRAGFSLSVARADAAHVVVAVAPSLTSGGVSAFGAGSMLRVKVSRRTTELTVSGSEFGSTLGLPMP